MQYIVKITKFNNQARITLPKSFLRNTRMEESKYAVLDDKDIKTPTIRRFQVEDGTKNNG